MKTLYIAVLATIAVASTANLEGPDHMVTMTTQDKFAPMNVQAKPGTTIRWTNRDAHRHTVQPDTNVPRLDSDGKFPNGLAQGESFAWTVPNTMTKGTVIYYHCRFHGASGGGKRYGAGMVGSITVR